MDGHCFEGTGAWGRVTFARGKSRHLEHAQRRESQFGTR